MPRDSDPDRSPELAATATAAGGGARPESAARLERGDIVGRYTVVETLGEGGMGVVYGVYDPDLDRKVALKLLRVGEGGSASDHARARLLREARAMAKLSHANVIRVYEVGTVGETDFVAMEFVDGGTLRDWLETARAWPEVVRIFTHAGRGLAAAHRAGLVHRDFKPANVLLDDDGRVLVTDFGLAQVAGGELRRANRAGDPGVDSLADTAVAGLTRTGAVLGTPAYMAPEQLRGEAATERSDQFGFCVALYEGLYGERPFAGASFDDIRAAVLAGRVADEPRGSRVPSWLRKVVVRGLSVDPAQRYPDMESLLGELRRDPARTRRRLAAGGVLALTAAGILYLATGTGAGDKGAAACADGEQSFAGVWDEPVRARLAERFGGGRGWDSFAGLLDRYKSEWKSRFVASCEASREGGEQSGEDHVLVTGCLLERRDRVRSLVSVFDGGDRAAVDNAVAAAQALAPLSACDDVDELRRGLQPPSDPTTRARVAELRGELQALEALEDASQHARALQPALAVTDRARSLDYPPVLAEALYRLGRVYFFLDRPREARAALEESLLLADTHGHDEVRARALVAQFLVEVHFNSDDQVARRLAEHARAAVARWGRDPKLGARIENGLGQLDLEAGDVDAAFGHLEQALSILERDGGELEVAAQRARMANLQVARGDIAGAREKLEDALRVERAALGDEHPDVAAVREQLGFVLREQRDFDGAREQFALARAFWDSPRGREVTAPMRDAVAARGTRQVRGVVLDPSGNPVVGAEVVAGEVVLGDGAYFYAARGGRIQARTGNARTLTDSDGRFDLDRVIAGNAVIGAELPAVGRSMAQSIDGTDDRDGLELRLVPYGTVRGVVHAGKTPSFQVGVSASPATLGGVGYMANTSVGADGSFELRLPAGRHQMFAAVGQVREPQRFVSRTVDVRAGQVTEVEFELPDAGVTLEVVIAAENGAPLDDAQVFVFDDPVDIKNARELRATFSRAARKGTSRTGFVRRRHTADGAVERYMELDSMAAGTKSVCVIPITGELKDPRFAQRLQGQVDRLEVHCRRVDVAREPEHQRVRLEVPPMKPLPPPPPER